jgi:hypothetical protein
MHRAVDREPSEAISMPGPCGTGIATALATPRDDIGKK